MIMQERRDLRHSRPSGQDTYTGPDLDNPRMGYQLERNVHCHFNIDFSLHYFLQRITIFTKSSGIIIYAFQRDKLTINKTFI